MIRSTHSGVTDSGCWDITVGRTITHTDLQNPLGRASAAGAASSWHAPLQPHKGSLCVPPECNRVQTCLRATICAFLFPSVYLCMSLRVHVSWYLWPVYELLTRCAGWDPTSQWDSTDWGQERKWVSILSSHCCIVVGGGRLVLVRWPRREEKLQGAGVGKRGKGVGASILVAVVVVVPEPFPQLRFFFSVCLMSFNHGRGLSPYTSSTISTNFLYSV